MKTMFARLGELENRCGFPHLPRDKWESGLGELLSRGMWDIEDCTCDENLLHVLFPPDWRMEDDEESRTADPRDIGSVVILHGKNAIAYLVAGSADNPHHYSLSLP